MSETITVFAVFIDMENDVPDAYVLTEAMAKYLLLGLETGDYVTIQMTMDAWLNLLRSSSQV